MSKKEGDNLASSEREVADEKARKRQALSWRLMCSMFGGLSTDDCSNVKKNVDSLDIDGVVKYLKTCKNVICMIGAGISTSAGIPDFRSPGTGLYSKLESYKLPTAESIFDINYFKENPQPFFTLTKEIFPSNFKPTISHFFLRLLHDNDHLLRIYSQNIDMLEHMIGVPEEKIHNAHGSFKKGHCISCKKEYSLEWMKDEISAHEFLKCNNDTCSNGLVKPDIVFFGEALPDDFFNDLEEDFAKCDLLIIIGTSLKVHPFAGLTTLVEKECPRILINRDPVGNDFLYDDPQRNYRDVFLPGECDEICLKISNLLKLENKLKEYQVAPKVKQSKE